MMSDIESEITLLVHCNFSMKEWNHGINPFT
jgi:hypothetical protein